MKKLFLTLAITSLFASSVYASDIPVPEKPEHNCMIEEVALQIKT